MYERKPEGALERTYEIKLKPVDSLRTNNPAAFIFSKALSISFPKPEEPEEYYTQAEALTLLRSTSKLKREDMAFRLGMSVQQYDRAEAGSYGGKLSIDLLKKCIAMALICHLPRAAKFFGILQTHGKSDKQPMKKDNEKWWEAED